MSKSNFSYVVDNIGKKIKQQLFVFFLSTFFVVLRKLMIRRFWQTDKSLSDMKCCYLNLHYCRFHFITQPRMIHAYITHGSCAQLHNSYYYQNKDKNSSVKNNVMLKNVFDPNINLYTLQNFILQEKESRKRLDFISNP